MELTKDTKFGMIGWIEIIPIIVEKMNYVMKILEELTNKTMIEDLIQKIIGIESTLEEIPLQIRERVEESVRTYKNEVVNNYKKYCETNETINTFRDVLHDLNLKVISLETFQKNFTTTVQEDYEEITEAEALADQITEKEVKMLKDISRKNVFSNLVRDHKTTKSLVRKHKTLEKTLEKANEKIMLMDQKMQVMNNELRILQGKKVKKIK